MACERSMRHWQGAATASGEFYRRPRPTRRAQSRSRRGFASASASAKPAVRAQPSRGNGIRRRLSRASSATGVAGPSAGQRDEVAESARRAARAREGALLVLRPARRARRVERGDRSRAAASAAARSPPNRAPIHAVTAALRLRGFDLGAAIASRSSMSASVNWRSVPDRRAIAGIGPHARLLVARARRGAGSTGRNPSR